MSLPPFPLKSAGPLCSLAPPYCRNVSWGIFDLWCAETYVVVSGENLANVATRVFVQLLIVAKDYDCDIDGTEDGELMRLLEKTPFALEKCAVDAD
jgi:hypothetical protein